MTKFKVGDHVRYTGNSFWKSSWQDCIVTKIRDEQNAVYLTSKLLKIDGMIDTDELELIPPNTFEVGKMYKRANYMPFVVLSVGEKKAFVRYNGAAHEQLTNLNAFNFYSEYTPPPPQEWRAVYWHENGKPEISATYWPTEEEVKKDETSHSHFMYAIRTDRGVLN